MENSAYLALPLFAGLAAGDIPAALAALDALCRPFAKGETLLEAGQRGAPMGVVLAGRVQVNKGALIMSVLEPGDLFGAAALFNDRADYATTLTARAPCRVLLLPQALVEELMGRFPEVGRNYVAYLSGRICFLSGKIDALTAGSAERKVAQYLLSRLEGGWVELDCSAAGLARRLGVSRASLYRALDALAGRGVLRREGRRVQVLQPDALEQN